MSILNRLKNSAKTLANNAQNVAQSAVTGAVNTAQNAVSGITQSVNQIGSTIKDAGTNLAGAAANAGSVLQNAAGQIVAQPGNAGSVIQNAAGELVSEADNAANKVQSAAGVIAGEANNIYNTAQDTVASVKNDVNNIAGTAQNAVNDILGGLQRDNSRNPVSGSQAPSAGGTTGATTGTTGGTTGTGTGGTTGTGGNQAPSAGGTTGTGAVGTTGTTEENQTVTSSDLTTADVNARQNALLQEMMNFWNTPFQYNAKESPLYTILQQQQAKEARLASGRAYSRAVANTGGFGSSYATLAAEEAGRQVMEGWDDQQYDLYQAAKDEWKSKWTNMVEEYNFLTGVQDRENAKSNERRKMVANSVNDVRNVFGTTYDEGAIRAYLAPLGYTEEEIQQVLKAHETYSNTQQNTADNALVEQGAAYVAEVYGTGYNANQIREDLKARGYSDAVIDRILQIQYSKSEYYTGIQNGEYYTMAMSYVKTNYGNAYNADAIRAELKAMNIPDDVIEQVLAVQKMRYEDAQASADKEAYNEAMAIVSEAFGYEYDEDQIKAILGTRGYSEATINEVLASQQKVADAFGPLVTGERITSASNYLRTNYGDDRDLTDEDLKFYSDELKNLGYTDAEIKQALAIHQAYVDHMSDSMAGQEYASALSLVSQAQGTAYNESLIRSMLTNAGYSEDVIQSVLETQQLVYNDAQASADKEAYNEAMAIVSEAFGYEYDEEQIKAILGTRGYSEETINEVLASQQKVADAFAPLVKGERVNAAADYLKENFGDYRELTDENMNVFKQALKNEGYTDEEINDAMVFYQAYIGHLNDTMKGQEYASALSLVSQIQGTGYNEAIIRDILKGAGYSDDVINSVVETQQLVYNDAQASADKEAYNSAMAIVSAEFRYEYDESKIRAILGAKGYSDEIIEEVLASQQKVADAYAPLVKGERVNAAADYLKENFGDYRELTDENLDMFKQALKNEGYTDEEINDAMVFYQAYIGHLNDTMKGQEYASALSLVSQIQGTGYNEAIIRDILKGAGYSDDVINSVVATQKLVYDDAQASADKEAYNSAMAIVSAEFRYEYDESRIRAILGAKGYSDEIIEEVLASQQKVADAYAPLVRGEKVTMASNYLKTNYDYDTDLSEADLNLFREELGQMGYSEDEIEQAIDLHQAYVNHLKDNLAGEEYISAVDMVSKWFGTDYNEAAIRQMLTDAGYSDELIDSVLQIQNMIHTDVQRSENQERYAEGVQFIRDSYGLTYNRSAIESDLLKMGYTPTEIIGILANHKAYVDAMQPLVDKEVIYNSVNDLISAVPEYNEEAAMAYLDALGISDTQYAQTLSIYRNFMNAMTGDGTEEERLPDNVISASQALLSEWGTDYAPETMKQYLLNSGYTEEEANAAIEAQRGLGVSVLQDYSPASVSDAQSFAYTLKEKLDSGLLTVEEYDELVKKNGEYIMQYITPALDNINAVDYTALGISQEEWDSMDDAERKAEIFDMAGELRKENMITLSQFYRLVYTDLKDVFASDEYKEANVYGKMETWLGMAKTIEGYYNSEYVNQDMYVDFLYNVVGKEMYTHPAFEEFVKNVRKVVERYGKEKTKRGLFTTLYGSGGWPYVEFGTYGSKLREKNESKDLLLKMAMFMVDHNWDLRVGTTSGSTSTGAGAGNTTGSTSTGVSPGGVSMEVTQDVR